MRKHYSEENKKIWKILNPDWKIMIWDEEKSLKFLEQNYANKFFNKTDKFPFLIIYHFGGIYANYDYYCNIPIQR